MSHRTAVHQFEHDQRAPGGARRFIRSTLEEWGFDALSEVAELLVSEVVTNAVGHAASGGEVVVTDSGSCLRVEVSDTGGGEVRQRSAEPEDVGGRGMAIVAALSSRWGVSTDLTATDQVVKTVWFEIDLSQ